MNIMNINNINPFIHKDLFISPFDTKNELKDIIANLPLIPKLYFNNDKFIDVYNDIKIYLKNIETIKNFILSILKTSQDELLKIKISKQKYKLYKNNLLLNQQYITNSKSKEYDRMKKSSNKENKDFSYYSISNGIKDTFKKTFTDEDTYNNFFDIYKKNNYNILIIENSENPYFYNIFQNEYKGKSKHFFIELFNKYIEIRTSIINKINDDNAKEILGYDMLFELNDNLIFNKIKNVEKNKIKKKNKSKINNNKYVLLGENFINNKKVKSSLPIVPVPIKPSLKYKIEKFNLLYREINNIDYYINLHNNRLTEIYNNILQSINNTFNDDSSDDLYNIIINLLEIDFNLIKFILYYIDRVRFNKFILNHLQIKKYIYEKIHTFSMYYEPYIDWYNLIMKKIEYYDNTYRHKNVLENTNFQKVYDKLIDKILNS